jgi:hypothetical protein
MTDGFYDELAESYHLIFDDWDVAIPRQRDVLARLLPAPLEGKRVLDCACGIGNQAIGLGMLGFTVRRVRFLCNFDRPRATRSEAIARGLRRRCASATVSMFPQLKSASSCLRQTPAVHNEVGCSADGGTAQPVRRSALDTRGSVHCDSDR